MGLFAFFWQQIRCIAINQLGPPFLTPAARVTSKLMDTSHNFFSITFHLQAVPSVRRVNIIAPFLIPARRDNPTQGILGEVKV